jgi:hypothetical protein
MPARAALGAAAPAVHLLDRATGPGPVVHAGGTRPRWGSGSGPRPFDEPVVHGDLFPGTNITQGDVDAVPVPDMVGRYIGRVTMVDEPGIVAAEDEAVQPEINVPVV